MKTDRILSNLVSFRDKLVYGDLSSTIGGVEEARQIVFGSSSPFLLSRFGNVEYTAFRDIFDSKRSLTFYQLSRLYAGGRNRSGIRPKSARMLRQNAGVYSVRKASDFDKFYEIYKASIPRIDYFFRWFSGDALLVKAGLNAQIAPLEYLNILKIKCPARTFQWCVIEINRLQPIHKALNLALRDQVNNVGVLP